eukprot:CAMPEP_0174371102 /NCGR_PEP_ID=MMETSP0811_2-20130205/98542_1 /TAXON_ID=73025 ORGANISM="Eutreptiella gymnastica-like, Strain CCMP1594" /NCGR_SAMPLE_ID=MMETSP0811_2 /ASSEMBLY_ACC=CAM_ASM_000667 /LENGTH=173 /DNA_ID=CAMNT_0015517167 /DNA_START=221 /DNA_END=740 /DNA_ORIENTATION=+
MRHVADACTPQDGGGAGPGPWTPPRSFLNFIGGDNEADKKMGGMGSIAPPPKFFFTAIHMSQNGQLDAAIVLRYACRNPLRSAPPLPSPPSFSTDAWDGSHWNRSGGAPWACQPLHLYLAGHFMAINCDTSPTTFAYGVKATSPVFPPVNVFWPRLKVPHNVVMHTIVAVKAQ